MCPYTWLQGSWCIYRHTSASTSILATNHHNNKLQYQSNTNTEVYCTMYVLYLSQNPLLLYSICMTHLHPYSRSYSHSANFLLTNTQLPPLSISELSRALFWELLPCFIYIYIDAIMGHYIERPFLYILTAHDIPNTYDICIIATPNSKSNFIL